MEEQQIRVKNLQVNYKIFGQGKPMLILHGWPSGSEKWMAVGELLATQGIRVIVPDLPGFGKSEEPAEAWNTDGYIEWVREFADNVEDLQKEFILLGHSFGGGLAAKFAVKYNQRLSKLFLVSAAAVREVTPSKKFFYGVSKIVKIFSFIPYYDFFRRAVYKFIFRKSDYIYQKGIMRETYLKVIADDLSHRLSFIKVPAIILWGSKDTSTPPADGKFINEKIRGSKLVILEGKKHSLQLEAPEELVQKILENV